MHLDPFTRPPWWKAYSFILITGVLFLATWIAQFYAQAAEVAGDVRMHGGGAGWDDMWPRFWAATFENWQSEFLQLCWQAAGLSLFYHWGSSQSREQTDRVEAKLDELLQRINPGSTVTYYFRPPNRSRWWSTAGQEGPPAPPQASGPEPTTEG